MACIGAACVLGVACTPVPEDATLASPTLWEEARNNRGFVIRALSGVLSVWDTGLVGNETSATCGDSLQHKFNCTEEACEDLVSGASYLALCTRHTCNPAHAVLLYYACMYALRTGWRGWSARLPRVRARGRARGRAGRALHLHGGFCKHRRRLLQGTSTT
ncbi:hypothetical protein EON68_03585 [archaeon]|nr:MAG: hypothetical protein EON68_03585 [archaeon]